VTVRPAVKAKAKKGRPTDAARAPERSGPGHVEGRRAGHRVRRVTTTKTWCTRWSWPTRPMPARAPAPRRTAKQVKHSTKKPFKQKGTGRARAGMTSSPLWRGGGRIFPNMPDENFSTRSTRRCTAPAWPRSSRSWPAKAAWPWWIPSRSTSPKTKPLAAKLQGHEPGVRAGDRRRASTRTCTWHRATWSTCWWSSRATPIRCRWSTTARCW
jgi:hypothetical protein